MKPPEELVPRSAKPLVLVVMVLLIFVLLLLAETTPGAAFHFPGS